MNIKKCLSDEFNITITNVLTDGIGDVAEAFPGQDIYLSYSASYDAVRLFSAPKNKRVSGVTVWYPHFDDVIRVSKPEFDHFHANNWYLYKYIKGKFKHTYYVPNGVDADLFKPLTTKKHPLFTIGHVGKPTHWKNYTNIIKPAFDLANRTGIKMRLKINQLKYKKAISQEEMIEWYQDIDAFIMASGKEEGTPNPALEAAACGKPIIGARSGNMPELIKDNYNGFLCGWSVREFADKIDFLKKRRDRCAEMGLAMRQTILDNWTWKKNSIHYRNMFRNILKEQKK